MFEGVGAQSRAAAPIAVFQSRTISTRLRASTSSPPRRTIRERMAVGRGTTWQPSSDGSASISGARDEVRVFLQLTRSQALVLFEWLTRIDSAGEAPVEDPAEQRVLWLFEGQLEGLLSEPLGPDYKDVIAAARKVVREGKQ